jgi:hypothetical protein
MTYTRERIERDDPRCWRCGAPKSRHRPGPPTPPDPRKEGPFPCGSHYLDPPEDLEAEAWRIRRERDEYKREAAHYRRLVLDVERRIQAALYEGNAS